MLTILVAAFLRYETEKKSPSEGNRWPAKFKSEALGAGHFFDQLNFILRPPRNPPCYCIANCRAVARIICVLKNKQYWPHPKYETA
jgi:hypothetical protein